MEKIKILSLDLSLNLPAMAVGEVVNGIYKVVDLYHVDNKTGKAGKRPASAKLYYIVEMFKKIKQDHPKVDFIVREKGFSRFPATTQKLFRVVGLSDYLGLELFGCSEIAEIPPTSVKNIIAGYGKASKDEVDACVRELLASAEQSDITFYSDDESDAVAVGLTFAIKNGLLK